MYGADVKEAVHVKFFAHVDDVLGPSDVDKLHALRISVRDIDDAGTVNDDASCGLFRLEEGFQLLFFAYVSKDDGNAERADKIRVFPRQDERAHFFSFFAKRRADGAAEMSVCPCDKINGFHGFPPFVT